MKRSTFLCGVLLFSATAALHADVMVFDRGLPTANLNSVAGANRSNVAWADGPTGAIGDDFNLGVAGNVQVTDLRVWIVGTGELPLSAMWSDLTLFGGGLSAASVGVLSTVSLTGSDPNVIVSQVTYADGSVYQASSGRYITSMWQVDFLLNWVVDGSATNTFYVGGTPTDLNIGEYAAYGGVSPFLHSSNAALSGSPQQGADNQLRDITYTGSTVNSAITWDSNPLYWDKSSDANVQIFAAPVPEPGAVILLGTLLGLLAVTGKRKLFQR